MLRTSSSICACVRRTFFRLCVSDAENGIVSLCAPALIAASRRAVRHQHRDSEMRNGQRVRDDFRGIGELRQKMRRHEAADFDLAQAARGQRR
jgi:hypothetical protein